MDGGNTKMSVEQLTPKKIAIAAQMLELRDAMKRLYGEKWGDVTKDYRCTLALVMERTGNTNPLSAVIPLAKDMSANGHNPLLLMSVAVDMADA